MLNTSRRSLITGLISLIAALAVVKASSLMQIKGQSLLLDEPYGVGPMMQMFLREGHRMVDPPILAYSIDTVIEYQGGYWRMIPPNSSSSLPAP